MLDRPERGKTRKTKAKKEQRIAEEARTDRRKDIVDNRVRQKGRIETNKPKEKEKIISTYVVN